MVYNINIRPSKHLTDLLSTYLDFDSKQLKVGLWGGDLNIQHVNLKKEAFTPLLNSWKDKDLNISTTTTDGDRDRDHHEHMNIAQYLSKQFLIDEPPCTATTLDLKLIHGSIGLCRAKIPWQSLLLSNNVETVQIDLKDVYIQIGVESCLAKALMEKQQQQPQHKSKQKQKQKSKRRNQFTVLEGNERLWKQEMIRIAEECMQQDKDIPSPTEYAAMKEGFMNSLPSFVPSHDGKGNENGNGHDNEHEPKNAKDEINAAQSTFLERFVKSFATSIGWRVGKGLKVTMQNVQIVMVQGGVEVGVHTDVMELFEYQLNASGHGQGHGHGEDESVSWSVETPIGFPFRKKTSVSGSDPDVKDSSAGGNHATDHSNKEHGVDAANSIRKKMKVSNCGVFVREAIRSTSSASTSAPESKNPRNFEVSLDEFVIQPTNVLASLCLRKTGLAIDLEDVGGSKANSNSNSTASMNGNDNASRSGKTSVQSSSPSRSRSGLSEAGSGSTMMEPSSVTTTATAATTGKKKPRRGKMDRKRKIGDEEGNAIGSGSTPSISIVNHSTSADAVMGESASASVTDDVRSLDHSTSNNSQNPMVVLDGINFAESSALVSSKIKIEGVTVVVTTRSLHLFNRFLFRIEQLKDGRPSGDWKDFDEGSIERLRFSRQLILYAMFRVLKDMRRRQVLEEYFAMSGAPFVPSAMRPFRQKYIEHYSQWVLNKGKARKRGRGQDDGSGQGQGVDENDSVKRNLQESFLQRMEDTLPVEQILLFRKLAEKQKETTGDVTRRKSTSPLRIKRTVETIRDMSSDPMLTVDEEFRPQNRTKTHYRQMTLPTNLGALTAMRRTSSTGSSVKAPKHQRNQSLNMDTMNESLEYIPASRHVRYNTELSIVTESKILDESVSISRDLERKFDEAVLQSDRTRHHQSEQQSTSSQSEIVGTVSSSISIVLSEFKFFFCDETGDRPNLVRVNSGGSDMSILTANSGADVEEKDLFDGGLTILGLPHTIAFSFTLLGTKIFIYKDLGEETKMKKFVLQGIHCRLRETDILWAGMVQSPHDGQFDPISAIRPQSIGDLSAYQVCQKNHLVLPFAHGELKYRLNEKLTHPLNIDVSITSKISSYADVAIVKELMVLSQHKKQGPFNFAVMSDMDKVRFQVVELLQKEYDSTNSADFDLRLHVEGAVLTYPIIDPSKDDIPKGEASEDEKLLKMAVGEMLVSRKGQGGSTMCNVVDQKSGVPSISLNSEMIFVFQGLEMSLSGGITMDDITFFQIPLEGEIIYSNAPGTSSRSDKKLMIHVSPLSLVLSEDLMQLIFSGMDPYREVSISKTVPSEIQHGIHIPRLSVFAGLRKLNVQLRLDSLRVSLAHSKINPDVDNSAEKLQMVALEEILSDFLSFSACFPPPYSGIASLEARSIALCRISAVGLSKADAETFLQFALDDFLQELDTLGMDSSLARNEKIVNSVGLSPGRFDTKERTKTGNEVENILDNLLRRTIEKTHTYWSEVNSNDTLEWTDALVCDAQSGVQLDIERFFYDWKVTGQVKELNIRNGGGRKFISLSEFNDESSEIPANVRPSTHAGLSFTVLNTDEGFEFGEGGLSFSHLSERSELMMDRSSEVTIETFVGGLNLQFSDIDWTNAAEHISLLLRCLPVHQNEVEVKHQANSDLPDEFYFTTCLDIYSCEILLCTDDFQPFSKIALDYLSVDIVSNRLLHSENKRTQVVARGDNFRLFDLSPEGHAFEKVVVPRKHLQSTDACFEVRMNISNDTRHSPSELLVVFNGVRLIFLQRFLNELNQYFLTPQYGVGHFLSIHTNPTLDDTAHHYPMSYQICLKESSIIFPKSSNSDDLIAVVSQKIVLASSYESKSFTIPHVSERENHDVHDGAVSDWYAESSPNISRKEENDLPTFGHLNSDSFVSKNSKGNEYTEFDPESIFRCAISGENVRIFTGLPLERYEQESMKDFFYIAHYLDIGEVIDGSNVYQDAGSLPVHLFPKKKRMAQLCARVWEEVTVQPVQFEVYMDFLPSCFRVLIKDQITFDDDYEQPIPFNFKLRMSQLYAILSMWYGNMQELPVLFPYSIQSILDRVEVPPCPSDWPEYGTDDFLKRVRSDENKKQEIIVSIANLELQCSFDPPTYFSKPLGCNYMIDTTTDAISLRAAGLLLQVDFDAENIMRVGFASKSLEVTDFRGKKNAFEQALNIPCKEGSSMDSLDMQWGLGRSMADFSHNTGAPFRFSVYMTPDRWCLANIGMVGLDSSTNDLAFFWILLEYFSAYFVSPEFGNPYFDAELKRLEYLKQFSNFDKNDSEMPCLNLDVRLWLDQPRLALPTNPMNPDSRVLVMKAQNGGIFYRYKTIDYDFYAQNVVTQNLDLLFLRDARGLSADVRKLKKVDRNTQIIASGVNLNVQYDMHIKTNHVNVFVSTSVPDSTNDIESFKMDVEPLLLPPPTVCHPRFRFSKRRNVDFSCVLKVIPEDLQMVGTLLYNFGGPYEPVHISNGDSESDSINANSVPSGKNDLSISATIGLAAIRLVVCEPILGMHLPIANIYLSELRCTISDFKLEQTFGKENLDFQSCVDTQVWVDYYKSGPTRSWEPLLEPYKCTILYEKSSHRGVGITVNSETPFHLNISGAFLETFHFATSSLYTSISKMIGKEAFPMTPPNVSGDDRVMEHASPVQYFSKLVQKDMLSENGEIITIAHEKVQALSSDDLVAFSLMNKTGGRIRFHQQFRPDGHLVVAYIDNLDVTALSFPPTRSVFRNLEVVEVSSESLDDGEVAADGKVDSRHYIDVQIPGMDWCRAISVDMPGKRFLQFQPRSGAIMAKIQNDWRLANMFSMLMEVSSLDGGRQVTLSSLVEVVNKTRHRISLAFHTDPTHFEKNSSSENYSGKQGCDEHEIEPDESFQVPMIIIQAALELEGTNLGSFWVRPKERNNFGLLESLRRRESEFSSNASIGFCSRSVNILNLVKESSQLFKDMSSSIADMNTEYHLFCPIIEESEELISPFCYCVEVKRSPVVSPFSGHGIDYPDTQDFDRSTTISKDIQLGLDNRPEKKNQSPSVKKNKLNYPDFMNSHSQKHIHGPVAYSLVIHPPLVVENLLPEPARFEIMHATKRQVVWWSDLKPGESIPIHTVGLDSALYLMINVGYCRTPVGEGARIHHGSDIIKRVQGQDKILSSVNRMRNDESFNEESRSSNHGSKGDFDEAQTGGAPSPPYDFVDTRTTVVDSIGQKLLLNIDNRRGDGGQRHITISCPYWIVNTTEYPLLYKQEKSSNLVSGSITSASKDGSKPVDSSKRNSVSDRGCHKTSFPGRPGALFGAKTRMNMYDYTTLLGTDIPLDQLSNLAFMFNYGDSHRFGGNERLSLKLVDSLWRSERCSEWSRGFSLDSVGVLHVVSMQCVDGRQLEVAAIVAIPDGALSKYTKIVRVCPRYILINQLSRPIRLWQDSSLVHPSRVLDASKDAARRPVHPNWRHKASSNKSDEPSKLDDIASCQYDFLFGQPAVLDYHSGAIMSNKTVAHKSAVYIATAASKDPLPFHLPDTRADRELRIDLGPNWNLSASFPADIISDYTLKMTRVVDLRLLKHVDNRGASKYKVNLPPTDTSGSNLDFDGELGLWFETIQWNGSSKCVVKGLKHEKFSSNNTDIHVGDELLAIDGTLVSQMEFSDTMKLLKERLTEVADACKMKKFKHHKIPRSAQKVRKPKFLKRFDRSNVQGNSGSMNASVATIESSNDGDIEIIGGPKEFLTLEFQTLEYRMKRVRDRALQRRKNGVVKRKFENKNPDLLPSGDGPETMKPQNRNVSGNSEGKRVVENMQIEVSMKLINQSAFVFINEANRVPPYRIENRSLKKYIYFRQRACENHPWNALAPGESVNYTWEEPLKPSKLVVRVGNQGVRTTKENHDSNKFRFKKIESEDQGGFGPSKMIRLDEVGLEGVLPCFDDGNLRENSMLLCTVDTDGATRVLIVSDNFTVQTSDYDARTSRWASEIGHLQNHRKILTKEIEIESSMLRTWREKRSVMEEDFAIKEGDPLAAFSSQLLPTVQEDTEPTPPGNKLLENTNFCAESDHYEDTIITKNHQVFVEVIEASGLQSENNSAMTGLCSPYCSVRLESRSKNMRRNLFVKDSNVRRTYFIERCSSPKWSGMKFVFDVPVNAVSDPHGFAVLVKVKDRRLIGFDRPLGRTEIHLRNLRNQKEVIGWFPLLSRAGKGSDLANPAAAGRVQGSIKLRAQWIYTQPALLDYYILLSSNRMAELQANRDAITVYYEKMKDEMQKQKELYETFFNMQSLTGRGTPTLRSTNLQLESSDGRWTSAIKQGIRAQRLRNLWKRQQPNIDNTEDPAVDSHLLIQNRSLSLESVKLKNTLIAEGAWTPIDSSSTSDQLQHLMSPLPIPRRGLAFSEGDLLQDSSHFDAPLSSRNASRFIDQNRNSFETLRFLNVLKQEGGSLFHHHHMENIIFTPNNVVMAKSAFLSHLLSWISAYDILNDQEMKHFFLPQSKEYKRDVKRAANRMNTIENAPYEALALPIRATRLMKKYNIDFRNKLLITREHFDKAAQRSLMAVLNPGGWLKLRPITALCLQHDDRDNKFTGMFVRVRYGSKSRSTATVDATVTPTWTEESDMFGEGAHDSSFFDRRENDLEVKIEPLKTSVALQLSVFGTRMNTKVELGVLQIPLAHAISCCTEASENNNGNGGIYVRWFPLKDPKDCIDGDGQVCYRPTDVEQISDDRFTNYMTPCIKLAMWWDPDAQKKSEEVISAESEGVILGDGDDGNQKESVSSPSHVTGLLSQRYFHASIDSVSAAMIDSFRARELFSFTTNDIDVRYSHTKTTTQIGMAMAHLQLDHHDEKALEPVILYPRPVPNPQPTIQFLAIKNNVRSKSNLDSFKHIAIALEEMDLRIEETWMFDVWEFLARFLRRRRHIEKNSIHRGLPGKAKSVDRTFPSSFANGSQITINEVLDMMNSVHQQAKDEQRSKQIYIEKLMVAPVKFNISYVKSSRANEKIVQNLGLGLPRGNKGSNDESYDSLRFEIFRQWAESGHDEEWSTTVDERTRQFQNMISAALPGITDAPIRVNGKVLDNLFKTWDKIISDLQNYYLKEMLFQVYKILGSVDFFGNPTMAVNSIMKGAHDFVVLPFREFIRSPNNPSKLGIGVAKGTLSFVSHFFSGVFGFVSNISEAGGTAAAALSFDEHFKRWHKQQVAAHFRHMHGQFRPKGGDLILTAVTKPLQDILAGFLFAVSGVLVEPYKGAQLKGMTGFSKGLGVGTVGLVAKPLVGVFDAFAHVSESMHDFSRSANILGKKLHSVKKMRLPYVFGMQRLLLPYNSVDACSANLLRLFPFKDGTRSQSDDDEVLILSQVLHRGPGLGWYIVVTTTRIVKFIMRYDGSEAPISDWQVKLSSSTRINSRVEHCTHNDVLLEIRVIPTRLISSPVKTPDDSTSIRKSIARTLAENSLSNNDSPNQNEPGTFLNRRDKATSVHHALGAFGGNRNKKRERNTYYVAGDLQTERDALVQVHNAICCLTKQYGSIMSRTYTNSNVAHGDREGHTSFGHLHFDEKYDNNTTCRSSEGDSSDHLDSIPWVYSFDEDKHAQTRSEWQLFDELQASKVLGDGPDWLVEARARATFRPAIRPAATFLSLNDKFQENWKAEISEKKNMSSAERTLESSDLHYAGTQSGIVPDGALTPVTKDNDIDIIFENDEGYSPIESKDTTFEERLENVEHMLERLLRNQTQIQSTGTTDRQYNNNPYPPASNISMVSALTDHIPIIPTAENDHTASDETAQLRREVEMLKKELAERETEISHTQTQSTKDGTRKKRRFKKLWKS